MEYKDINEIAIFEHEFWLQILGDHSRFILNALSPTEKPYVERSKIFITAFDDLLEKSREDLSHDEISALNQEAYTLAMKLKEFKINILSKKLVGEIKISLTTTFINHMLNELDEYIRIILALIKGIIPQIDPIQLHLLWLPDGSGHASTIADLLNSTEKLLIKEGEKFSKDFDDLYLSSLEFEGFMRTCITKFPSLTKLNHTASQVMNFFKDYLNHIKEGIIEKKILGAFTPLEPDHMFREECYYLTKLYLVSDIKEPKCDPRKPRVKV